MANEHQDFRGAKNNTEGRAYDFLLSDNPGVLNQLNINALRHLAIVDQHDLQSLEQRKLRIFARHPAKPFDHIAFADLKGNTSLSFDDINFHNLSNSDLILYIRLMRTILREVWDGD